MQAICLLKFQMGPLVTVLLSTGVMVMLLVGWCRTSLWTATKICACCLAGCVVLSARHRRAFVASEGLTAVRSAGGP